MRLAQLRRRDAWTRRRVEQHQAERLAALVRRATDQSPFYRARYRAAGVGPGSPLTALPTVDKPAIMGHFDEVVTDRRLRLGDLEAHLAQLGGDELYLGEYRVVATGGTSGVRGVFPYDRRAWALSVASSLRTSGFIAVQSRLGHRVRTASVTATNPVHWGARYAATSGVGISAPLHLDARTPLAELVAALNRHRPELLTVYPSIGVLLAREQLAGHLRIRPAAVVTSGEPQTEEARRLMCRAWDEVLFDGYATTETGLCGMECTHHRGIHLLEDLTIFEVVDDDGRPAAPGVEGRRLLVTNLFNTALPLIRYELSDLVTIAADPCPCGRPWRLAAAISGRREDILRLPASTGALLDVHPTALTGPLERMPGVRRFRIVHEHEGIIVSVVAEPDADAERLRNALEGELRAALDRLGVSGCPVRVELAERVGRVGVAGKLKLVEERTTT